MLDLQEFLWGFSILSLLFCSLHGLTKALPMALSLYSPSSPISWVTHMLLGTHNSPSQESALPPNNTLHGPQDDTNNSLRDGIFKEASHSLTMAKSSGASTKLRKRPGKLVVPEYCPGLEFSKLRKKMEDQEFHVQGRDYCLATKKGRRETLEDAYGVMLDIFGDSKQAFFAVVDGHGGRDAADYVVEHLGKNIINALEKIAGEEEKEIESAIRKGHRRTDEEFLSQGVGSGACAASVLVKDGELHVANVGDCRVVLSRNGVATPLTKQHRLCREEERLRIEKSGGFVECKNGVWRVQGSLAVSRAIGDLHLKEWVISEPEIHRLPLTPDCQFLIMASDGLWDKVKDQEAVDEVMREMGEENNKKEAMKACKMLLEMSFRRGNMDDVTVMVVQLQHFFLSI
ncbi:probable protein phosphatase 2C 2 [Benincasa hispida]|uniref:probable protein phosphatase 2C 2 n=1 Tax=Benincasa hispida TaxID=102211 RepID=UPI001901E09E|nr:probable protein phosphatase 2C 2 [Benincasa hispida]